MLWSGCLSTRIIKNEKCLNIIIVYNYRCNTVRFWWVKQLGANSIKNTFLK